MTFDNSGESTNVFVSGQGGYHTNRIPSLVVTARGTLLAFAEGRKGSSGDSGDIDLLLKRSRDQGRTWTEQRHVPELVEPICPASIRRHSWPDADRRSVLLFANPASTKRERITLRASFDEGQTWPAARVLDPRPGAYCCLAVMPDGTIGILYEAGERSPYENLIFAQFPLAWLTGDPP